MDAEGLGGPGVDRARGNHREHLRMVSCFREVNSDVNCRHLSVPLPSRLWSFSGPISTEDASTACRVVVLGLLWLGPEPPLAHSFQVTSCSRCPVPVLRGWPQPPIVPAQ